MSAMPAPGPTKPNDAGLSGPARDREVTHLVIDRGMDVTTVGQRFRLGSTRVQQIIARETQRQRIISFLAARRDEPVSAGEIAHGVKVDVLKVDYVVRALVKTGRALASSTKTSTSSNGVRETWEKVRLTPRGIAEFEKAARPKRTVGSSVRSIIVQVPDKKKEEPTPETDPPPAPAAPLGLSDPNITKLLSRSKTLQEAAALIESAGDQYADLALVVLGKIDEFTPLEREVVEHFRVHHPRQEENY